MSGARIVIIGNSGSGKSTLAAALAARLGLATLDLDSVAWLPNAGAERRDAKAAAAMVRAFCRDNAGWVVEGCYASLGAAALEEGALLIFLDPGTAACLDHCRARPWEPHKFATAEEQASQLAPLLDWVRDYETRDGELSRAGHEALFAAHNGPKRHVRSVADQAVIDELVTLVAGR